VVRLFFQPLQLHLEPSNLLEQFGLLRFRIGGDGPAAVGEDLFGTGEQLLFPGLDERRVDPYWLASSLTVRSPLRAAKATWALNAGVCCFRLPFIVYPFPGPPE
jgi:hypothetical protein